MATQFSENEIFCHKFFAFEKKNSSKNDRKWVFWGWCRHIYAYYGTIDDGIRGEEKCVNNNIIF